MATRSRIGLLQEDGTVKSIYCHWDGYPSNNGELLKNYYTDVSKVNALLNLGDISSLEKEVAPKDGVDHNFQKPCNGVVIAYGRDRGETGIDAIISKSEEDYFKTGEGNILEEYNYIGKLNAEGKVDWYVFSIHSKGKGVVSLNDTTIDFEQL